jgi:hypothetical protein
VRVCLDAVFKFAENRFPQVRRSFTHSLTRQLTLTANTTRHTYAYIYENQVQFDHKQIMWATAGHEEYDRLDRYRIPNRTWSCSCSRSTFRRVGRMFWIRCVARPSARILMVVDLFALVLP